MPGKMARSDPRPSVRVTRGAGSVSTSRLSCKRAGKTRTLMPVWDSSGESRLNGVRCVMGMEAADPMRIPRARNASFNHAPRYAVIAGQLFRVSRSFNARSP